MMMRGDSCSQTMYQKSTHVLDRGPCVAMYLDREEGQLGPPPETFN